MKNEHGQNVYAVPAFGPPEEQDDSPEGLIIKLMARYDLGREECLEVVDEVLEAFGHREDAVNHEEPLRQLNAIHRRAWQYLIEYQANQKTRDEVRMSTRAAALELGFTMAAGARTAADLARLAGFDKQAVNKCLLNVQRLMGLARREGQRGDEARANMAVARREQIDQKLKAEKLKS